MVAVIIVIVIGSAINGSRFALEVIGQAIVRVQILKILHIFLVVVVVIALRIGRDFRESPLDIIDSSNRCFLVIIVIVHFLDD